MRAAKRPQSRGVLGAEEDNEKRCCCQPSRCKPACCTLAPTSTRTNPRRSVPGFRLAQRAFQIDVWPASLSLSLGSCAEQKDAPQDKSRELLLLLSRSACLAFYPCSPAQPCLASRRTTALSHAQASPPLSASLSRTRFPNLQICLSVTFRRTPCLLLVTTTIFVLSISRFRVHTGARSVVASTSPSFFHPRHASTHITCLLLSDSFWLQDPHRLCPAYRSRRSTSTPSALHFFVPRSSHHVDSSSATAEQSRPRTSKGSRGNSRALLATTPRLSVLLAIAR